MLTTQPFLKKVFEKEYTVSQDTRGIMIINYYVERVTRALVILSLFICELLTNESRFAPKALEYYRR